MREWKSYWQSRSLHPGKVRDCTLELEQRAEQARLRAERTALEVELESALQDFRAARRTEDVRRARKVLSALINPIIERGFREVARTQVEVEVGERTYTIDELVGDARGKEPKVQHTWRKYSVMAVSYCGIIAPIDSIDWTCSARSVRCATCARIKALEA